MDSNSKILTWYAISTIWVIIILNFTICSSFSLPLNNITLINHPSNLDDYLYNYSLKSLPKNPRTGVLYNLSLPANFSDMKVSILRLRSSTLWYKGANSSYFEIPPKILTIPYVRRLEIMYENLGNLSTHYYNLSGYTLITKVIGLAIYNASDLSAKMNSKRVNISLYGEKIKVKFSREVFLLSHIKHKNKGKKCVRFDPLSGVIELGDMLRPNVCLSQGLGHFAIAMPSINGSIFSPPPSPSPLLSSEDNGRRKKKRVMWWVVGFVVGFVVGLLGLVLLVLCCVFGYGSRKIQRMERTAENSEALEMKWIGDSKLPFGTVSRTHGVLEEDFVP